MTKIKYWKDIDVLNIEVKKGKYEYSEEVAEGVILDISKEGDLIGVEILDATKKMEKPVAEKIISKYAAVKA